MKRLLTTLVILLVVLVTGMTALVLLVDPNDFRTQIIQRVEQKNGYTLSLDSDFRWHVWPQLSIISGQMSLTAPGASTPLVRAENMRLDVKLWPLLSHQLVIKQVMLNRAVIHLTADSEQRPEAGAPIAPGQRSATISSQWNLDIDKVLVIDSVLVWQQADDQITVRDIKLSLEQDKLHHAKLDVSSRVSRDQRELTFSIAAEIDLQRYPRQFMVDVKKFTYKLEGVGLPVAGISGLGSLQASYQDSPRNIVLNQLMLSANDNQFTGSLKGELGTIPHYIVELSADKLNLNTIADWQTEAANRYRPKEQFISSPVIADQNNSDGAVLRILRNVTAQLGLTVNHMVYRDLSVTQLNIKAINQQGKISLKQLSGKLSGGDFSVPSSLDVTGKQTLVTLEPVVNQVELGQVFQSINLPQIVTGKFSMKGLLSGEGISTDAFSRSWQGDISVSMTEARLHDFNIQQVIQQAIARVTSDVRGGSNYERYTEIQQLQTHVALDNGKVIIDHLHGGSEFIKLTGHGAIDLVKQQCDIDLGVRVIRGWQGETRLVNKLQQLDIPLRVYGQCNSLKYQLNVDHLLRDELQEKVKKALNNWLERGQQSQKDKEMEALLDKL